MNGTLAIAIWPRLSDKKTSLLLEGTLLLAGSLVIGLLAQLSIPLPFTPVPITGQTLGVVLVGAALGSRRGALSVALYLLEGLCGLPVLAPAIALGPTAGYLLGFVPAAFVTGLLAERGTDRHLKTSWLTFLAGQSVVFLVGIPWLALYLGSFKAALFAGLLPFIPGELVKTVIAAGTLPSAWKFVRSLRHSD